MYVSALNEVHANVRDMYNCRSLRCYRCYLMILIFFLPRNEFRSVGGLEHMTSGAAGVPYVGSFRNFRVASHFKGMIVGFDYNHSHIRF